MISGISNKTTGKEIISKAREAKGIWGRLKGLMFERKENFDYGLVFESNEETRMGSSIHMMFVFFPIDAVYLDSGKKVVDVARSLTPFTLNYTPKKKAKYLIELPAGKAKSIEEGNILSWGR